MLSYTWDPPKVLLGLNIIAAHYGQFGWHMAQYVIASVPTTMPAEELKTLYWHD